MESIIDMELSTKGGRVKFAFGVDTDDCDERVKVSAEISLDNDTGSVKWDVDLSDAGQTQITIDPSVGAIACLVGCAGTAAFVLDCARKAGRKPRGRRKAAFLKCLDDNAVSIAAGFLTCAVSC